MKTRELLGNPVYDRDGDRIGRVEDIVVDPLTGRLSIAVIALADEGDPDEFLPVPWGALSKDPTAGSLRLEITERHVAGAPTIASDELDVLQRRDVSVEVFSYYGLQPPWDGGAAEPDGARAE